MVGLPRAEFLHKEEHVSEGMHNHFLGHLVPVLKTHRVAATLPHILHDTERYMDVLAADPERYINAFDRIEILAFQLMTRSVVCDEIAEDPVLLSKTCNLFTSIAKHATPFMVLFPSTPCPGQLRRIIAGLQLYRILSTITNERRSNGRRANDPLQYLMDQGESNLGIFKVCMPDVKKPIRALIAQSQVALGSLAGGLPHMGTITTWVLLHLAANPSWHARTLEEIRQAAGKYNSDPSKPLSEQLLSVPLEGWDSDFPLLNTCLNESVRLNIVGTHFRRNSSVKTLQMDNAIIAPGAYVVHNLTDTHQDPQLYPSPLQWDPARFESGRREFDQSKYGFIGWGAGRHLCPGQRLARLNFKIMISSFLVRFDYELCNSEGEVGEVELPHVDLNARHVYKPKEGIYIKYKERDERIYRREKIELS